MHDDLFQVVHPCTAFVTAAAWNSTPPEAEASQRQGPESDAEMSG